MRELLEDKLWPWGIIGIAGVIFIGKILFDWIVRNENKDM